ncbi:MAG: hypothetical protein N2053_02680 [Chitinispirillaceae bacterium]|nr:hypothetical protein [Chitinispirillaceae bacterium]
MMSKKYISRKIVLLIVLILVVFACNKKPNDNIENKKPAFVALWSFKIAPLLGLKDTLTISLNIKEDNTYTLLLTEHPADTLFSGKGKWVQKNDSLILTGSECKYLDTLPDPDTLAKLADSVCGKSISLLLPLPEDKVWNIPTADFSIVLYSFPVSKDIIDMLPSLIPVIPLTKEDLLDKS